MLRFYPKTEKRIIDVGVLKVVNYQACDCGRGHPVFQGDPGTHISLGNCEFCRYKTEWVNQTNEYTKFHDCMTKHKCEGALFAMIQMNTPLNSQWWDYVENPDETVGHYFPTLLLRQVTIEGQPLYVQLWLQYDHPAQCNALCFWHNWRLQKKKTWRQCGYSHKCLNDGSGWALMAPANETLLEEFAAQF